MPVLLEHRVACHVNPDPRSHLALCCAGRYVRTNLNMPPSLPARIGGYRDYDKDGPITVFGSTQARLVGKQSVVTVGVTVLIDTVTLTVTVTGRAQLHSP